MWIEKKSKDKSWDTPTLTYQGERRNQCLSQDFHNRMKYHRLSGLQNGNLFCKALEGGKPKINVHTHWAPMRAHIKVCRLLPSHRTLTCQRQRAVASVSFYKGTNPIIETLPL